MWEHPRVGRSERRVSGAGGSVPVTEHRSVRVFTCGSCSIRDKIRESDCRTQSIGCRASVCRSVTSVGASGLSVGPWERPGDGTWKCTERRTVRLLKCRHWSVQRRTVRISERDVRWSAQMTVTRHTSRLCFLVLRLAWRLV
jgi:hypothetical protein